MLRHDDTIAAIATPPGEGGIGVIRISGPEAPKIVAPLWRGPRSIETFASHRLYHGPLFDPKDGQVLDSVLLDWMRAPHSYTGEEVIEIQAHGGPALLQKILGCLLAQGARLARPGEFTERAFLNKKLDLSQAEGVADLIASRSELALNLARQQLGGHLSEAVGKIRNELKVMRAQCEAMLDFPEDEDVQVLRYDEITERVDRLSGEIRRWLTGYEEGRRRREGVRVVLAGRPNVGKSSLLNALLAEDRAIVHSQAGTTRDVIEAAISLNGLLVRLFDTAGLRKGKGEIETEGIRRSWEQVEQADLVLFVVDSSEPLTGEDHSHYEVIQERPHMVVANKSDLPRARQTSVLGPTSPLVEVSAKTGAGLEALKAAIFETVLPHGAASDQWFLASERHKVCLEKTREALAQVRQGAEQRLGLELLAADLLVAANHLGEITGEITHEEILGEIFSRFCLGK